MEPKLAIVIGELSEKMKKALFRMCMNATIRDYTVCSKDLVGFLKLNDSSVNKDLQCAHIKNNYILIKGNIHTDLFLKEVISLNKILSGGKLTHCAVFYNPSTNQQFIMTDGACNIEINDDNREIAIKNAIELYAKTHTVNITTDQTGVNVSLLSAGGDHNKKTNESLYNWWSNNQYKYPDNTLRLEQLDVALNEKIRQEKLIDGKVADIIVVNNIGEGNAIWKSLTALNQWECYGILMGSPLPIVLNSRGDNEESIKGSIKIAAKL